MGEGVGITTTNRELTCDPFPVHLAALVGGSQPDPVPGPVDLSEDAVDEVLGAPVADRHQVASLDPAGVVGAVPRPLGPDELVARVAVRPDVLVDVHLSRTAVRLIVGTCDSDTDVKTSALR